MAKIEKSTLVLYACCFDIFIVNIVELCTCNTVLLWLKHNQILINGYLFWIHSFPPFQLPNFFAGHHPGASVITTSTFLCHPVSRFVLNFPVRELIQKQVFRFLLQSFSIVSQLHIVSAVSQNTLPYRQCPTWRVGGMTIFLFWDLGNCDWEIGTGEVLWRAEVKGK